MTPEALGYKKKAEKALQAAEVLLKEHLPEDALSRVYYAMFYGALAALSTLINNVEWIPCKSHTGFPTPAATGTAPAPSARHGNPAPEYRELLASLDRPADC